MNIRPNSEPIPGYLVEERLGAGQFGEVWRARSPGNTYVALKFLQLSGKHGWKEFRAVQRVKQIRHANLMPIIAIWLLDEEDKVISDDVIESIARNADESNGEAPLQATLMAEPVTQSRRPAQMIIANLLANQSLGDRLKESQAAGLGGIPVDELLGYMDDAAKGLDFLNSSRHKIGDTQGAVQHCDVKPDNIMLTGGSAVVTDFGVAQLAEVGSGATATSMGGTPAYMAPECFDGKTSNSTDQYALAITYYQLRTGCLPFEKETYGAVYETHKSGTHDFSAVPPREQAVLRKATTPNPERRYSSCVELVQRLHEAVGPLKSQASRKKMIAVGAAALVAVLALAWAMSGLGGESNYLDDALGFLNEGNFGGAVTQAEKLPDAEQVNEVLLAFQAKLADSPHADPAFVAANIRLIRFLRGSAFEAQLDQNVFNDISTRVATDLDQLLSPIRVACDDWDPKVDGEELPSGLSDQIDQLNKLICTDSTNKKGIAECVGRQPALEMQRIRIEARAGRAAWPKLRTRLETIRDDELPKKDAPYVAALGFILDGAMDDATSQDKIQQRLTAFRPVQGALAAAQLAAWEQSQITTQLQVIDKAIQTEWLVKDKSFSDLVGSLPSLPKSKAAKDRVALSVEIARQCRREKHFSEARENLNVALALVKSISADATGATNLETEQQIQDELFMLDLVDPATPTTVLRKHLAGPKADFLNWERVADRIHEEYALAPFDKIDSAQIDAERAALVEALRLECQWATSKAEAPAGGDIDAWRQALEGTSFADYGQYVESLRLWRRAELENESGDGASDASRGLQKAFAAASADSLLDAAFRRETAHSILLSAVKVWSKGQAPTDQDFGAEQLFAGESELAYGNLALARTLGPPSVSRDALLLAAAVAGWSAQQDQNAPELLAISQALIDQGTANKTVQALLGTIHFAAVKARLAAGAPDLDLVQSASNALAELYLNQRLGAAGAVQELPRFRLDKIKTDLLDPALPAADRIWEQRAVATLDEKGVAALSVFFRAAGFLYDEDSIAAKARYKRVNSEDFVFDYLGRSNELAPDAVSLIVQARSIEQVTKPPANWRDLLNALAERALESALRDGAPALQGRAFALKAYARLLRARDSQRSTGERNADRLEVLQLVDRALAAFQDNSGELSSDYADSLTTRSAINIEFAFFGNLDEAKRKQLLLDACRDAKEASEIGGRKNPEYAFIAWGDGLEDLAFYLYDKPGSNYELACEKFAEAIQVSRPADDLFTLQYAKHINAHKNLLRCCVRQAMSGVLLNKDKDRVLLVQAIADVRKDFPALEPESPDAFGVDAKTAGDIAELLYGLSAASTELAKFPGSDSATTLKDAETSLANAVKWARKSAEWDNWAQYQCVYAAYLFAAGQTDAAIAACREVLDADHALGVKLQFSNVFLATIKLQGWMTTLNRPWSDADWDQALSRFPSDEPLAAKFLVQLRMRRILAQQGVTESTIAQVDGLLRDLEATDAQPSEVADLHLVWVVAQYPWFTESVRAAVQKIDRDGALRAQRLFNEKVSAALAQADELLPQQFREQLSNLKSDVTLWGKLTRWEKVKLQSHLIKTFDARCLLAKSISALIRGQAGQPDEALMAKGMEALMLTDPDLAQEFLDPTILAQWSNQHAELSKVVMP